MRALCVLFLGVFLGIATASAQNAVSPVLRAYLAERSGDLDRAIQELQGALAGDPESAEIRVQLARALSHRRRFEEALQVVSAEGALARQPQLLLTRGRLLDVLQRKEEAAEATLQAAKAGAGSEAYALGVRLLDQLQRTEEALRVASEWAEAFTDSPEPLFALGRLGVERGDMEGARRSLGRALELDPNHRPSLRVMAGIEEDAGNFTGAEVFYRRLIEANPHDVEARFRLGQILLKQDRLEDAVEVFEAAERWSGGDPGLRFRLGVLLLQSDRPSEAESVFRTLAEAHGGDTRALYLLGVSLLAQEKYEDALEVFERLPPTSEEYPDSLVRRAIALESLDRNQEARALLERWLEEHPDDEEVTLALAGFHEDEGDYRAAIDVLEEYLTEFPSENARVYFTMGVLHDKLKDWRRSAEYIQRSLELSPDDPHALNYLGYTYAEHGVYLEEAERLIIRALELKPGDGFITDSLGWVYYKQGRYDDAVRVLREASELAPKDPVIWEHLGDALRKAEDPGAARQAYEKAAELAPDSESVRRKLEELR